MCCFFGIEVERKEIPHRSKDSLIDVLLRLLMLFEPTLGHE
jgi:hypothetical protein